MGAMARQKARSFGGAPVDGIEFRVRVRTFVVYRKGGVIYLETLRKEVLLIESLDFEQCIHGSFSAHGRELRRVQRFTSRRGIAILGRHAIKV